jgi:hypothetical protein
MTTYDHDLLATSISLLLRVNLIYFWYRRHRTESAIFMYIVMINASEGSLFILTIKTLVDKNNEITT